MDLGMDNKYYIFKDSELGIKQLIEKNVKKSQDSYNVSLKRVKMILKMTIWSTGKTKPGTLQPLHRMQLTKTAMKSMLI